MIFISMQPYFLCGQICSPEYNLKCLGQSLPLNRRPKDVIAINH